MIAAKIRLLLSIFQYQRAKHELTERDSIISIKNGVLWTRRAVSELIRDKLGIDMPIRTVGDYLKRWGMTPQKPAKQAYEQNPKAVQRWLDEEYPVIKAQAKREKRRDLLG